MPFGGRVVVGGTVLGVVEGTVLGVVVDVRGIVVPGTVLGVS